MIRLLFVCLLTLTFNYAQAETKVERISGLTSFIVTTGNAANGPKYSQADVIKMLGEGNTCVKDGVKVLFKSKNITKKHCQKAKYLENIRVIKANQTSFYKQLLGL